jgi:hypothetical protein
MSRRCDVLLIDESTNLDKAGVGYLAERLAPTGKQTLLVIHRDELVAAMPQPIVVERASVPGYWSCFDCSSPSPDSGAYFGWPATVSVSCSPGFGACSSAWSGRSCVDSLTATSSGCGHRTATTAPARARPLGELRRAPQRLALRRASRPAAGRSPPVSSRASSAHL